MTFSQSIISILALTSLSLLTSCQKSSSNNDGTKPNSGFNQHFGADSFLTDDFEELAQDSEEYSEIKQKTYNDYLGRNQSETSSLNGAQNIYQVKAYYSYGTSVMRFTDTLKALSESDFENQTTINVAIFEGQPYLKKPNAVVRKNKMSIKENNYNGTTWQSLRYNFDSEQNESAKINDILNMDLVEKYRKQSEIEESKYAFLKCTQFNISINEKESIKIYKHKNNSNLFASVVEQSRFEKCTEKDNAYDIGNTAAVDLKIYQFNNDKVFSKVIKSQSIVTYLDHNNYTTKNSESYLKREF